MARRKEKGPKPGHRRHPSGERLDFVIQIRLTQAQYGALTILAEQHGITLSGAARHALDRYFSGFKNENGQTLLEVAAEATPSAAFLDYLRELQREANEAKEHTT